MLNEGHKAKTLNEVLFRFEPIITVGLPELKKIIAWRAQSRRIRLAEDWFVRLPRGDVIWIPRGFSSDGSSLPRLLRWIDDPFGCSLTAGIIHDFLYKYRCLLNPDGSYYDNQEQMSRFTADDYFKRINMNVNDLGILARLMYMSLRLVGSVAWNQHRKHDGKMRNNVKKYLPKEDGEP